MQELKIEMLITSLKVQMDYKNVKKKLLHNLNEYMVDPVAYRKIITNGIFIYIYIFFLINNV